MAKAKSKRSRTAPAAPPIPPHIIFDTAPAGRAGAPDRASAIPTAEIPTDALAALSRLRAEASAEVERLLAFLDATDADPDLEDVDVDTDGQDGDPPEDDGHSEPDDEPEDGGDGEPSLGSIDRAEDQEDAWRCMDDRDAELDEADNPRGELDDADHPNGEFDPDGERGIGDADGLAEQGGQRINCSGVE